MIHEKVEEKQTYVSVHILQLPVHLGSTRSLTHAERLASSPTQQQTRWWLIEH